MNKREKILVVLSSLALLYGLFNYFILPLFHNTNNSDDQGSMVSNPDEIAQIDSHLLTAQMMVKETKTIDSMIGLIEADWNKDPFKAAEIPKDADIGVPQISDSLNFIYSGFIQIGNHYLAVINGMEYSPGEIVQDSVYTVGQISPDKIILNRDGKKALTLYLKED